MRTILILVLSAAFAFTSVGLGFSQASRASDTKPIEAEHARPATPAGKLLDKLDEQNHGPDRFHDDWLLTLKSLADLGPDAVPDLIAELDVTTDDMMLRCCGFTLRAINDPRAIPALIRAIPKTLLPPGSDMGLKADDQRLADWARQYDLNGDNKGNRYGFGRPVREIFGALRKLSGQEFGEEDLYHMFLDGLDSQRRMKRELFDREAARWAEWWDEHAQEFTPDPAYARVNLPPLNVPADVIESPPPGARYKISGGASGWLLQSVLEPNAKEIFFDLDTGRATGLPKKWRDADLIESHMDDIVAWAFREGFDLMATEYTDKDGRYYVLRGIGLSVWELAPERWKMSSDDITVEALQAEGTRGGDLLLHIDPATKTPDPKSKVPFLYITRRGMPGLLFVGIPVTDDGLKPGGFGPADPELSPIAFRKGRRFGFKYFEELK
ncbi:MAG TPA: hypothetical protein VGN12_25745 [Pirellulales bacterium]|jgi:hypothetical protein